jgi:hypothetical protein
MALELSTHSETPTRLVSAEFSAHWYSTDGEAYHTVPDASGFDRPTTLRDVRKLAKEGIHLLPSVTSVMKVKDAPQLNAWKITQVLLAADERPRLPGESLEDWASAVEELSKSVTKKASNHGTAMHDVQERLLPLLREKKEPVSINDIEIREDLLPFAEHMVKWINSEVVSSHWEEKVLVGAGYAGKADALIDHSEHGTCLIDLKNRSFDPEKVTASRRPVYAHDAMQLGAYRKALGKEVHCMSVILSSKTPSAPYVYKWSEQELEDGWSAFQHCLALWCFDKKFKPKGVQ